jgi:hypothetical protein
VFPPGGAHLLRDLGDAPEFESGGAAGLAGRESTVDVRGSGLFEVVLHLVGDVLVGLGAMGERAQAAGELAEE